MNERMSKVVRYIENNLDAKIDVKVLSRIACYSEFHFHRLFRAYTTESVYAYKKRLLLERAIKQLLYSQESVTEIAFKCGYENQSSFNKAFKKHFSCTPSQVHQQMVSVQTANINKIEAVIMKAEIIIIDNISVICARETGAYATSAPKAWARLMSFAYSNKLMHKDVRLFGIPYDNPNVTDADHIRFDACVNVDVEVSKEHGLIKKVIHGGTYAKFLHKGAYEDFPKSYAYIFNEWLPESNYHLKDIPCFEHYLNRDPRKTKPENLRTEIYIPIDI